MVACSFNRANISCCVNTDARTVDTWVHQLSSRVAASTVVTRDCVKCRYAWVHKPSSHVAASTIVTRGCTNRRHAWVHQQQHRKKKRRRQGVARDEALERYQRKLQGLINVHSLIESVHTKDKKKINVGNMWGGTDAKMQPLLDVMVSPLRCPDTVL